MFWSLLLFIASFVGIWLGSGLIINSVEKLSQKLKASSFIVSFFLLGFITSITEVSVAFNAYVNNEVEISIGNLLGATLVLFLLVIPLLAIIGKGIKLDHDLTSRNLLFCIILLVSPILLLLDKEFNVWEGFLLMALYLSLGYALYREDKLKEKNDKIPDKVTITFSSVESFALMVFNIVIGSGVLIFSSNILVRETVDIAHAFGIAPFLISLLALSIGTNLPEIALMIRTILRGEKEIAFGNYLGSATFNTFLLGLIGVGSGSTILNEDLLKIFVFILIGLGAFYLFARTNNELSRREGIILLSIYLLFLAVEVGSILVG